MKTDSLHRETFLTQSKVGDLHVRAAAIERLIPFGGNARTHTEAQVAASIREFGWTNPILIRPDGVIIAGHARLLAARSLGLQQVPVIELSGLTEAQYRALAIADNQLALNAGWDDANASPGFRRQLRLPSLCGLKAFP